MTTRVLSNLVLVLVIALGVWLVWPDIRPMPQTRFNLLDGGSLDSEGLRGKRVLISFWSVSCEVCLRDMPKLARLHKDLVNQNFMVLGVAMPHDPPPTVIETVERLEPGYPIALDPHGELNRAFGGIETVPTRFLIGPDGNISYAAHGPLDEARLRATLLTI